MFLEAGDPAPQQAEVHCKSLGYFSETFTTLQVGMNGGKLNWSEYLLIWTPQEIGLVSNFLGAVHPVGAGVPAKGRKAAPNYVTDRH